MSKSSTETPEAGPITVSESRARLLRFLVYGAIVLAGLAAAWALIEGGDRDLSRQPAAILHVLLPLIERS